MTTPKTEAPMLDAPTTARPAALPPEDEGVNTGHVYDGIRELDHRLPRWWLLTLWGSIGFAFAYWAYYHTLGIGPSSTASYTAEADEARAARAASEARMLAGGGGLDNDALRALTSDPAVVAVGKTVYEQTCVACHRADGGGLVGPNLTDDVFVHGATPADWLRVVSDGVVAKGMPPWKPVLGLEKVRAVVVYLQTLPPAADGKPPESAPAPTPIPTPAAAPSPTTP
jgi:cytochrome c oxidase cbb3-type subunit 3